MRDNCKTCGDYRFSSIPHRCKPKWRVTDEEDGGDYLDVVVHASDAEHAAEEAVSQDFWDDPSGRNLPSGYVVLVEPRGMSHIGTRDTVRVSVTGEPSVDWRSTTLDPKEDDDST